MYHITKEDLVLADFSNQEVCWSKNWGDRVVLTFSQAQAVRGSILSVHPRAAVSIWVEDIPSAIAQTASEFSKEYKKHFPKHQAVAARYSDYSKAFWFSFVHGKYRIPNTIHIYADSRVEFRPGDSDSCLMQAASSEWMYGGELLTTNEKNDIELCARSLHDLAISRADLLRWLAAATVETSK